MIRFLLYHPEVLNLILNLFAMGVYRVRQEWGKVWYWGGAVMLTVGLLKMRG